MVLIVLLYKISTLLSKRCSSNALFSKRFLFEITRESTGNGHIFRCFLPLLSPAAF